MRIDKEEMIRREKIMGKYFKCTHKPTCLGCRREKAYYAFKLAGSDWGRKFWSNTYTAIELLYPDPYGVKEDKQRGNNEI